MQQKTTRLKFFARLLRPVALACLAAASAAAQFPGQQRRLPPLRPPKIDPDAPPVSPPPAGTTLKKPDTLTVPPSRSRRSYDAARDATYVNVDLTLIAHKDVKDAKGALQFEGRELTLTFQLAYRGAHAYDLVSAYLIVESTGATTDGDKLAAVRRLEVKADLYEYAYERRDYQTELVTPMGAAAQQLRKELAAFRLIPEDLPQLANAGRLEVKIGAESYTLRSPQLTELRRTLAAGANN